MSTQLNLENLCDKIRDRFLAGLFDSDFSSRVQHKIVSPDKFTQLELATLKSSTDALKKLITTPAELYWIAEAMEQVDSSTLKTSDYFSESDILSFKNYVKGRINVDDLYVFHDVFQLSDNQWTTRASINMIALQSKYNIICIDPNFQRQSKFSVSDKKTNNIIRKIYVNPKRVNDIENCLVDNQYTFNTIRLNLMDDGKFSPMYDENSHTLTIPKGADCIILDGNHRRKACEQAYAHHPELRDIFNKRYFQIAFTFFTPQKAKAAISQEWNTEKVNENHIKASTQNMSNKIVDEIIHSERAKRIYADKIVTTAYDECPGGSLIIYANLADAINKYYKANDFTLLSETEKLTSWIIDFYNQLALHFTKDFMDVRMSHRTRFVTNNYIMSYGFIYLSRLLYNHENWQAELEQVLNAIDWSKEHSVIEASKSIENIIKVEILFKGAVRRANV